MARSQAGQGFQRVHVVEKLRMGVDNWALGFRCMEARASYAITRKLRCVHIIQGRAAFDEDFGKKRRSYGPPSGSFGIVSSAVSPEME